MQNATKVTKSNYVIILMNEKTYNFWYEFVLLSHPWVLFIIEVPVGTVTSDLINMPIQLMKKFCALNMK